MIEPDREEIFSGGQELRRGVLSKSSSETGRVRQRHQVQVGFDARIHLDGPNRTSGSVRDDTAAGVRVRVEVNLRLVKAVPHRFIATHEVRFALPNRSAQSESKLVAFEGRRSCAAIKKVSCVELVIAKIFEKSGVKFIRAGTGNRVQNAAVSTSVFRPVVGTDNLNLQ